MNRRDFLFTTAGAASLAAIQPRAFAAANDQPLRVALIGCGWYGKTDLFHLMQVAPVEVVALCDVDSNMAAAAAELVAHRQPSKKNRPSSAITASSWPNTSPKSRWSARPTIGTHSP